MKRVVRSVLGLFSLFLASSLPAAPFTSLPEPRGERVLLHGRELAKAEAVVVGRGIDGIAGARAVVDHAGRELVWKQVRRDTDPDGNIHVAYQQYLVGNGVEAEIYGAALIAHYTPDGKLGAIDGAQFRKVIVANGVSFDRESAIDAAEFRLPSRNLRVRKLIEFPDDMRKRIVEDAKLMLVERDGVFRYTYLTNVFDEQEIGYQVAIDADTEEIIAVGDMSLAGNCAPSTPYGMVNATGVPVRSADGVPNRAIKANPTTSRPGFTHEGYWHSVPYKTVYQATEDMTYRCDTSSGYNNSYTVFPVKTDNGVPVYKYRPDTPGFDGSAAGDALYFTDRTLRYFVLMGRKGWDNNYGAAKIVTNTTQAVVDTAEFNHNNRHPRMPNNAVLLGKTSKMYNAASSLDWIAHEWGHGVIVTSLSNFPYTTDPTARELSEGFADVIAHMVEKGSQPAGTNLEQSSDWKIHEDAGILPSYSRGAEDDGDGHPWNGPYGSSFHNDILHANDIPYGTTSHAQGIKLSVVHRLLAEGGFNPVCGRLWYLSGCMSGPVPALGLSKANRILFNAVQFYVPSSSNWSTLADSVALAAHHSYKGCSYDPYANAAAEQQAVYAAFAAIGHAGSGTIHNCF